MGKIIKNDRVTDIVSPSGVNYQILYDTARTALGTDVPIDTLNMVYGFFLSTIGAKANSTEPCDDQLHYALLKGYSIFNGGIYNVKDRSLIHALKDTRGTSLFSFNGSIYPAGDITSSIVLNVPDVFFNIQHCFEWLANKRILNSAHVDIKVADGIYEQSWSNNLNHVDGDKISIRGNEENPSQCVINLDNLDNRDGFQVSAGHTIAWLNGFQINGTKGWLSEYSWGDQCYGAAIRAFDGGTINLGTKIISNKMYYGLRAMHGATIKAIANVAVGEYGGGVRITHSGDVGIHAHTATIYCNGAEVSFTGDNAHGLGFGICAEAGGYVVCEYAASISNLKAGYYALSNGTAWAHGVFARDNDYGVLAWGGTVECNSLGSFTTMLIGNKVAGIRSTLNGVVGANKASINNNPQGVLADNGGLVDITAVDSINNSENGFLAQDGGNLIGSGATANGNGSNGFYSLRGSKIICNESKANNNKNIGYYSSISSKIFCSGFGGVGNSVFCSPTQSSVSKDSGNIGSYIIDQY